MGLGQRILGDPHGHREDHGGGLIHRARMYEVSSSIAFAGLRRRVFDGLVGKSGAGPGDRVLDVGCGTGYFARRAARAVLPGGEVVGIDPSPSVIEYARGRAPAHCTFVVAGAEALPQPDGSFDLVISSLAMHHLPEPLRPVALREMHRVLRPGGRLFIADFRPPANPVAGHLIGSLGGHSMRFNPIHLLAELIGDAGFRVTGQGDQRPWLHYVRAERPAGEG
jgi:ubiquinone/menaquinone biosynthesis C-methylase UbiE